MNKAATTGKLRTVRIVSLLAIAFCTVGCEGVQSALDPRSPQAYRIAILWWVMLAFATLIFFVVISLVVLAVQRVTSSEPTALGPTKSRNLVLIGGFAIPLIILCTFVAYSVSVGRAVVSPPTEFPVTVEVIGRQWWWEVNYLNSDGSLITRTANEIHLPAGQPVNFILKGADVIHSFWVPNLHGKTDMIPGQTNHTWFRAGEPGVFRGQCAEFCGLQHALMAFWVVVEPLEDFNAWLERQQKPIEPPADSLEARGREVFLSSSCVLCHTVSQTRAQGRVGPDLTNLGSRRTIAAGTKPNTSEHLAAWIRNPHAIKPGTRMPPTNWDDQTLQAVISYLQNLR